MGFHHRLAQIQTKACAPGGNTSLKHMGQQLSGNSIAGIFDRDQYLMTGFLCPQGNLTLPGVCGGILKQIGHHLHQQIRIAEHSQPSRNNFRQGIAPLLQMQGEHLHTAA